MKNKQFDTVPVKVELVNNLTTTFSVGHSMLSSPRSSFSSSAERAGFLDCACVISSLAFCK